MTSRPPFMFAYTPSVADLEAVRRLRYGTRSIWMQRLAAPFTMATGVFAFDTGDRSVGVAFIATGAFFGAFYVWLWWLRTRRLRTANPAAFMPLHELVGEHGMTATTEEGVTSAVPWSHWRFAYLTPDLIALFVSDSRLAAAGCLPRRGLLEQDRWVELSLCVATQVPIHPRSPIKPWIYSGPQAATESGAP